MFDSQIKMVADSDPGRQVSAIGLSPCAACQEEPPRLRDLPEAPRHSGQRPSVRQFGLQGPFVGRRAINRRHRRVGQTQIHR
jgi:hypothetical protein